MTKTSSSVPCEECGKVIAHIVDGNFVAVDPTGWAMTEDECEICNECLEKKYNEALLTH